MEQTFSLYRLSGTHREIGRQFGEACAPLIQRHRDLALERLETRARVPRREALDSALLYRPFVRQFAPFLDDEIQGIAESARLTLAEAYFLQLRAELAVPREPSAEEGQECTTFAVLADATADHTPLVGQNADLPAFYREIAVVLEIRSNDDLPPVLMLTPAGQVSYIGMNDRGLGVFANYLTCGNWRLGLPRYFLSRLALTQTSVPDAERLLQTTHRASSRNLIMLDAQDHALDLECTPTRVGRLEPQDGLLAHSNHFVSPELLAEERVEPDYLPNTQTRLKRMRELLEQHRGRIDVGVMQAILRDRACLPHALCRMPGDADTDTITFASFIAQPTLHLAWIAVGPPNQTSYQRFAFSN